MNKFLLISLFFTHSIFATEHGAAQFGRIVDLKGSGFISYKGKTREIKKGDSIEVGSEIVIEHRGQVTFTDNADHRFHMGNSSSVAVSSNSLELRGGDLWFQSLNNTDDYKVKTVNALVNYQGGEGILSYDSAKGKSQLMVINSMMKLSNLRTPELNLNVSEGHFSFIDNAYEEGAPRDPTPVGEKTYGQLVGLFSGVSPMDKNSAKIFKDHDKAEHQEKSPSLARSIASTTEHSVEASKEKVEIKIDHKMMDEYKKTMLNKKRFSAKAKNIKHKNSSEKISFHIYGQSTSVAATKANDAHVLTKARAPASVLEEVVPSEPALNSPYTKDYKKENKESDKLIDELKKL